MNQFGTTVQDVLPGGMHAGMDEQLKPYAEKYNAGLKLLMEAAFDIGDGWIDPDERFRGESGEKWVPLGGADTKGKSSPLINEAELASARAEGRSLAVWNEYAINGHENRINYIVGSGHVYTAVPKEAPAADASDSAKDASKALTDQVQEVLDDFVKQNKWHARQQENMRRKDRDGEVFLRFFKNEDKGLLVRAVEPSQVSTPEDKGDDPTFSFGIQTDPEDVETVLGYWIDKKFVKAEEIQHRKLGVDANVKRGIPLFFPCSKDLARADTIQRNMAVMSTIQSAIAMIRKHAQASAAAISNFVANNSDVQTTNPFTKETRHHKKYGAGTILDATEGIDYEFPSNKVNPGVFLVVRDGILRSVASRLVMPEFMLTSDASNANFASTMVAEGPAVKQFNRLQFDMIEDDREILELALDFAVEQAKLSKAAREAVEVDVEPPRLATRDLAVETEANMKQVDRKVMSKHTARIRGEMDPDKERELIEKETEESDPFEGLLQPGQQGQPPGQVPNNQAGNEDEDQ